MAAPSPPPLSTSISDAAAQPQVAADSNNGGLGLAVEETKPDLAQPQSLEPNLDNLEDINKYKRYEIDYTHRLIAKYFSAKTIYGGDVFEEKVTVNGETIKASRWPCTRSYADPVSSFEDINGDTSTSVAETPAPVSNGKQTPKKSP